MLKDANLQLKNTLYEGRFTGTLELNIIQEFNKPRRLQ